MTRALLLRAIEDGTRTAEKLRERGVDAVLSPVIEIAPTGVVAPPGDYAALIASSAKGVEYAGAPYDAFKALPFHAVGAKTARAAKARGWRPQIVAGSAEAILPLLLSHDASPTHFLYLAGRDRQAALEAGLRAGGHRVTAVDVYEARAARALSPQARSALEAGTIDVALHYSRRSAEIFLSLADAAGLAGKLAGLAHLALSPDVAAPLRAHGLDARVAATPDEAGLLALLAVG